MMASALAPWLAAGGGFLLAVLWIDLMFDVQARRLGGPGGEARLDSIAAYYRRVTTDAFPLNRMIGLVMLLVVGGSVVQVVTAPAGRGRALLALALAVVPIALAGARVFPNAVRLGARTDAVAVQADLARGILRDHVLCFVAILGFIVLQAG